MTSNIVKCMPSSAKSYNLKVCTDCEPERKKRTPPVEVLEHKQNHMNPLISWQIHRSV